MTTRMDVPKDRLPILPEGYRQLIGMLIKKMLFIILTENKV